MPLDNLPLDLQKRLEASKNKTEIDLSGCNLSWLSEEKFQALVDVLHQHKKLKKLSLKNCSLAYLDSKKLEALLIGLSNLKVLDLSDNQLCFYELIGSVLDISTHLPRLTKLLFWDEPHSAWIPTLFSSLKKLPLFRIYQIEYDIYFLNDDEANLLLEAIRTEEKMAQYYFGEPSPVNVTSEEISHSSSNPDPRKSNQSQPAHGEQNKTGTSNAEADKAILPASLRELINSYPNIKNWHNSHGNKIFSMPPRPVQFCSNNFLVKENLQMAGAIHFIDQLQVPGLSLRYFLANDYISTESLFSVDIDQGYAASFEQLMVALINADSFFQEMHARCFSEPSTKAAMRTAKHWQLRIPPYAISQVALDLFSEVYDLYCEHLEVRLSVKIRPENYQRQKEKLSKRPINVETVKILTRSFVLQNEFYDLTQNSQKLDDFISQIKSLFDAKATKYQVYEFFIVHQLSIISGIATLEELQTIMNISEDPEANHEDSTNAKKQLQTLD